MHHSELKIFLTNAQVKSKNNMHSRLDRGNKSELVHFPNQREKKEIAEMNVSTADNKIFTVEQQAVQTSTNKRSISTS